MHERKRVLGRYLLLCILSEFYTFVRIADKYPSSCVSVKREWTTLTMASKNEHKIQIYFYIQVGLGTGWLKAELLNR